MQKKEHILREEKHKNLAIQEKINEDGQKKFARRESDELGGVKEEIARKMFGGKLTDQQSLDLPTRTFAGGWPVFKKKRKN